MTLFIPHAQFEAFSLNLKWRSEVRSFVNLRAKKRAMRAMRVMRAMRATVQMLRIFICYIYIRMRTRTRATEQDE